jgi:hypothetical protein
MEKLLETSKTQALRESGIINQTEVVKVIGDICVAEDVVTGTRRVLQGVTEASVTSNSRRLLKD